jgi:hypothetical protein
VLPEGPLDLGSFPFSEQPIIDEDAGQSVTHCPMDQECSDRGIDPSAQGAKDPTIANPIPDLFDGDLGKGAHLPVRRTATNLEQEVADDLLSLGGMGDLRVELDSIQWALRVTDGGKGRVDRVRQLTE